MNNENNISIIVVVLISNTNCYVIKLRLKRNFNRRMKCNLKKGSAQIL